MVALTTCIQRTLAICDQHCELSVLCPQVGGSYPFLAVRGGADNGPENGLAMTSPPLTSAITPVTVGRRLHSKEFALRSDV